MCNVNTHNEPSLCSRIVSREQKLEDEWDHCYELLISFRPGSFFSVTQLGTRPLLAPFEASNL